MPCPTIHEFAAMADAIYSPSNSVLVPNYTRISFRERSNGFKGGLYRQSSGRNQTNIIAFAGTDMSGEAGTDIRDLAADVGFAGRSVTLAVYITNPAAAISIELGRQLLEWQFREALALVRDTLGTAGHGSTTYVVGHSLGGGLSQMVAAELGLKGMAFNAPTTSQLGYSISPANRFLCVNQWNDPVSLATKAIGNHLGEELIINNGTSGMDAHSMTNIVSYLASSGGNYYGQQVRF
ncbi:hypothetical protein [Erythrobacter sp. EC-HK427]|uniref:hypothetical protein n=1 Tax=Erythrobacter sp. EC-HK427 TaxID=2038396 RepID=UPI00125F4E4F|nr:hypothetical protein [Erythrobacter sp. EC-HK427]